jgi:hypothetical protein
MLPPKQVSPKMIREILFGRNNHWQEAQMLFGLKDIEKDKSYHVSTPAPETARNETIEQGKDEDFNFVLGENSYKVGSKNTSSIMPTLT